ncbi:MAG TPA: TonB-dependent receptor plug domain-containing protein [Candidatus Eremiobacteraceae bacterium]|nr:TonB-dependent receptor plug domain-containing protein [Candidatus Eremiobacteraceae bacterium]
MTFRSMSAAGLAAALAACAIARAAADPAAGPTASPSPSASPHTLSDVMITAQRARTTRFGTPRETYVVDASELTRLGATTIGEALALLPGIVINDYGTAGHLQTALLRGATSTETLVLLNGRPVNEPGVGLFDFSSLPVSAVARIEIVEGAASTLYGSSAMGGVINIITRGPSPGVQEDVQGTLGFEGAFGDSAGLGVGSANGGVRVDVSENHARDEFSYPAFTGATSGTLENDDTNGEDGLVTLAEHVGIAQATLHFADDTSNDGEPGDVDFGQSYLARQDRDFMRSDLEFEVPASANDVTVQLYSDGQRLHYYDNTPFESYDDLSLLATRGMGIRDTITAGANAITAGFDARGDVAQFDQTGYGFPPASEQDAAATTAYYLSDEIHDSTPLIWTFGVREERPQRFNATTLPSAGAQWTADSGEAGFRANYGRAFRVPALEETSPLFFGNPSLAPEYAATYDVGYFNRGFSATYFGMRASNLIVSEPPDYVPENVSLASIRGVNLADAIGDARGDHAQVDYTDYLSATDLTDSARLPFRPTATGGIQLWRDAGPLSAGLTLQYVGRRFADDPNVTLLPQYATLGAFASRAIGHGSRVALHLDNLTNERVESAPGYPVLGTTIRLTVSSDVTR